MLVLVTFFHCRHWELEIGGDFPSVQSQELAKPGPDPGLPWRRASFSCTAATVVR